MSNLVSCPNCNAQVDLSTTKECPFCGQNVEAAIQAAAEEEETTTQQEQQTQPQQQEQQVQPQQQTQTTQPAKPQKDNKDQYGGVKTEASTNTKCPNCGATVTYDPDTLSMTCAYCGYSRQLPKPDEGGEVQELDFKTAKIRGNLDWGKATKTVICKSCGAETIYDQSETASTCPYCGSTTVMTVTDEEDIMAPGGVVPFEISKDKAAVMFSSWIGKKIFTPSAAKKSCKIENINGVYLPFFTYDSDTTSSYECELGFDEGTGENRRTIYRKFSGVYEEFIDDMVVYASTKENSQNVKNNTTFDFSKLRTYSPEFIAGFCAERYTLGIDDGWTQAKSKIQSHLKSAIGSKCKKEKRADRVRNVRLSTTYDNITYKYILAPIWIAAFKYKDKVYNIAINGQTGKISGRAPISPLRVAIAIALVILAYIILSSVGN